LLERNWNTCGVISIEAGYCDCN